MGIRKRCLSPDLWQHASRIFRAFCSLSFPLLCFYSLISKVERTAISQPVPIRF